MKLRGKRLGAVLALGCALGVAVALYFETQPTSAEQHTRVVDAFGRLQTLDARISEEALAARSGFSASYDPLTRGTTQFAEALSALEVELGPSCAEHPDLREALAQLVREAEQRGAAVEEFKTRNAVLKNSLYYLPLAARQLIDQLESEAPAAAGMAGGSVIEPTKEISELVQLALAQNLLGGRAETARVEAQLEFVESLKPRIAAAALDRFQLLLAHARTVSRTQQQVDPILRQRVLGAPTRGTLAELERRYGRWFEAGLHAAATYRNILYAWSTLLLLAVLGGALKLRSLYASLER
ncbi:MAG TPA: DAHL domain-containing protein, partial [Polyangiaceae bacterium]|nr:DAHL domain-containing protein [Polyangiaceae bacterium]